MNTYANQNNINVYVDTTSVAIDDKKIDEGDIILLTPEVYTLEKNFEKNILTTLLK